MASLNVVTLIGHLGADPESRVTPSGQTVCSFRIATSERFERNGQVQEQTEWHQIVVWGKLAEICMRFLRKGRLVYVSGKLKSRTWDKPDGSKGYAVEVVARDVLFLGGEDRSGRTETGRGMQERPPSLDEEVPF
jgi:single-strand DNA-binding protein